MIVDFYKNKVDEWNANGHCGFDCFKFGAPLQTSHINIQQQEDCCVQVFLTDIRYRSIYSNTQIFNGYNTLDKCAVSFNLWILVPSELGVNNYNEILGHPITESKWETIFEPLLDCFGCGANQCEQIDNFLGYTKWSVDLVHNYADMVYDGIKISGEIEIDK